MRGSSRTSLRTDSAAHTAAMSCWAAGRRSSAENASAGGANNKPVAARSRKRVVLGDITNVFRGRGRSSGAASSAPAPEAPNPRLPSPPPSPSSCAAPAPRPLCARQPATTTSTPPRSGLPQRPPRPREEDLLPPSLSRRRPRLLSVASLLALAAASEADHKEQE